MESFKALEAGRYSVPPAYPAVKKMMDDKELEQQGVPLTATPESVRTDSGVVRETTAWAR